jgi:hypothetical protein
VEDKSGRVVHEAASLSKYREPGALSRQLYERASG